MRRIDPARAQPQLGQIQVDRRIGERAAMASSISADAVAVALTGTLPVEVLRKSTRAARPIAQACRTSSGVPSSPVSRISLSVAPPHTSRQAWTTASAKAGSPRRRAR